MPQHFVAWDREQELLPPSLREWLPEDCLVWSSWTGRCPISTVSPRRRIRQRRPAVDVIAYSAADDHAVAERFRRAGATAYIDKADVPDYSPSSSED